LILLVEAMARAFDRAARDARDRAEQGVTHAIGKNGAPYVEVSPQSVLLRRNADLLEEISAICREGARP
jgi:hypothetical protein